MTSQTSLSLSLKLLQNSDLETASVGENAKDSLSLDLLVADLNCCCRCCWLVTLSAAKSICWTFPRDFFPLSGKVPSLIWRGKKFIAFCCNIFHRSTCEQKKQRLKRTLVVFGSGHISLRVPSIEFRLQCMCSHVKT